MRGACRKKNKKKQISKWATSGWVPTSDWESLLIADQLVFLRFSLVFFVFLVCMMKKLLSYSFWSVFNRFQPCKRMRKHALAGRNTQQIKYCPWERSNFSNKTFRLLPPSTSTYPAINIFFNDVTPTNLHVSHHHWTFNIISRTTSHIVVYGTEISGVWAGP